MMLILFIVGTLLTTFQFTEAMTRHTLSEVEEEKNALLMALGREVTKNCWCNESDYEEGLQCQFKADSFNKLTPQIFNIIERHGITKNNEKETVCPRDCSEAVSDVNPQNGVYSIRPDGATKSYSVYCEVTDEGVYTYIQQRVDDTTNFERTWIEYKNGFGNVESDGNFYVGNELIYLLTNQNQYTLQVDLMNFNEEKRFARYYYFYLNNEADNYRLNVGQNSGTAGDMLRTHNQQQFSTIDADHDVLSSNCAISNGGGGGWWYYNCLKCNLNGIYYNIQKGEVASSFTGVSWQDESPTQKTEKRAAMKIIRAYLDSI